MPRTRKILAILTLLLAIATGFWVAVLGIDRFFERDVHHLTMNIRAFLTSAQAGPFDADSAETLEHLLATPEIRGVEVFSPQGRRVWSAGEPLELIAYRLNRETALMHQAEQGSRLEVFWPAAQLGGFHGLALRLDTTWQNQARRELILILFSATVLSAGLAALSAWLALRPAATKSPVAKSDGARASG